MSGVESKKIGEATPSGKTSSLALLLAGGTKLIFSIRNRMMRERWIWRCDRTIPSDTRHARAVLEEVLGQLTGESWDDGDVFSIHMAAEEALVNAVKHGNRYDPDKTIHICCLISPKKIQIIITDQGSGFDPEAVPDPTSPENLCKEGGRGVKLMRSFMSQVRFNAAGNQVMLEKIRGEGVRRHA